MSAKRTRISPRVRIKEEGGVVTSRPASTNSGKAVGSLPPFSDQETIVFQESQTVLYPVMLPTSNPLADVTGIVSRGRPTPGASDVHRTLQQETSLPFVDSASRSSSSFYLDPVEGMTSNFPGTLSSRMSIEIDISAAQEKYVYRCPKRHIDADPSEFTQEGTGFCYFNFANMSWDDVGNVDPVTGNGLKTDQVADARTRVGSFPSIIASTITSSVYYTGQFIPPNHFQQRGVGASFSLDRSTLKAMGYTKFGTPTATFLAPGASKYHAKESNTLKMSDYISQPFLLEKIKITLPVVARRTHSSSSYYNPITGDYAANDLHCRSMDNYVLFLYRQTRNTQRVLLQKDEFTRDSRSDVSGSDRYLIASASMCFYNSPTMFRGQFGSFPGQAVVEPLHSPAFSYDFNQPVLPGLESNPSLQKFYYTGSVVLEMTPEIYAGGLGGASYFPTTMSNGEDPVSIYNREGWRMNHIQHAWPGTAGSLPMGDPGTLSSRDFSGKHDGNITGTVPIAFTTYTISSSFSTLTSSYTNILNTSEYLWTDFYLSDANLEFDKTADAIRSLFNPDPRSFRTIFGPGPIKASTRTSFENPPPVLIKPLVANLPPRFIGGIATFGLSSANTAPIVLLPTDELVLGIDAGIAPFMRDSSTITGSFLKIEAKHAKMVLYGSQIVNGEKRSHVLGSQARSEDVHFDDVDTPVLDEFLLDPLTSTMRNYHAPLLTGSRTSRSVQSYNGYPTNFKFSSDMIDWWNYPRQVTLTDDRSKPVDRRTYAKFVFRNDKFGLPAHVLASPPSLAVNLVKETILPGSAKGGTTIASYPVTNIFTGSASFSGNTSLHATSSLPFFDTDS